MQEEAAIIKNNHMQIVLLINSEFDKVKTQYLLTSLRATKMNLWDICKWCKAQNIQFFMKYNYRKEDHVWDNIGYAIKYIIFKTRVKGYLRQPE